MSLHSIPSTHAPWSNPFRIAPAVMPHQPPAPPFRKEKKPYVGRMVHYVLPSDEQHSGGHRAAVIVGHKSVEGQLIANLQVFWDGHKVEFVAGVPYSDQFGLGTWHYIEDEA